MSTTESKEMIKNKKHSHWMLIPLVETYTVETTLAVFSLNPTSFPPQKIPRHVLDILKRRGYTRLYVLYLFSKIGKSDEIGDNSIDDLITQRNNEVLKELIPDVGKIFFAYGVPPIENLKILSGERVTEIKQKICTIKPDAQFYYFGEHLESGFPKKLEALKENDTEHTY